MSETDTPKMKFREWTLFDGDDYGPAWNGPEILPGEKVKVIELAAFQRLLEEAKKLREYLKERSGQQIPRNITNKLLDKFDQALKELGVE